MDAPMVNSSHVNENGRTSLPRRILGMLIYLFAVIPPILLLYPITPPHVSLAQSASLTSEQLEKGLSEQLETAPPKHLDTGAPENLEKEASEQAEEECGCRYEELRKNREPFQWSATNQTVMRNGTEFRLFEIQAPTCELRRFEHDLAERRQALDCLRDKHIVMIGDSIMRYEYMNLARWIGFWSGPHPWLEIEQDFTGWDDYYQMTNKALNGHELCDCYRRNLDESVTENRYYYNPDLRIRVTYLQQFFFKWGLKGHNTTWLDGYRQCHGDAELMRKRNATGCVPNTCGHSSYPMHWSGELSEVIDTYVKHTLRPTDLVINSGFWNIMESLNMTRLRKSAQEAIDSNAQKTGHVYYKTSTAPNGPKKMNEDRYNTYFEEGGWRILEAGGYTEVLSSQAAEEAVIRGHNTLQDGPYHLFYWDDKHLMPQVNAGINQVLLNMLCPGKGQCPGASQT